jgi:uncharacterized membrane protein (UPF0127 family)
MYIMGAMQVTQIVNLTKNVIIVQEAQLAVTLDQRMRGLLGRNSLGPNEALILKPCSSIHTFFMRFPIDVLFLDRDMQVIKVIHDLAPNRLSPLVLSSIMAIELPAGKVHQTNTQTGDKIELK